MASTAPRPMTAEEKKVIFASSLGTVFEWYDFYLYGSLAAIIAKQFFAGLDPSAAFIFALLAFAAGFTRTVSPMRFFAHGRITASDFDALTIDLIKRCFAICLLLLA